jgi:S-adenosylmethionine decarboxylase
MNVPFSPGIHLLIDFWGCTQLEVVEIEHALRRAASACGATVLGVQLHSFGISAGVTGVAMLAESHMSIHTWPELDYIALDIFMCGNSNPHLALPILKEFFQPESISITEHNRGKVLALKCT